MTRPSLFGNRFAAILSLAFAASLAALVADVAVASRQGVDEEKRRLEETRREIDRLRKEIDLAKSREESAGDVVDKLSRQHFLINSLVNDLRKEAARKKAAVNSLETRIDELQKTSESLKDAYADYVVAVYKGAYDNMLVTLLDAESLQQAILRYQYLRRFSERGEQSLAALKSSREELANKRSALEIERAEQASALREKKEEEEALAEGLREKEKALAEVRSDKAALERELEKKRQAESRIRNMIAQMAAAASKPDPRPEPNDPDPSDPDPTPTETTKPLDPATAAFEALQGRMRWPVTGGEISRDFGKNTNSKTGTVSINYGLDIEVTSDRPVSVVADGTVSLIDWMPGYGSVLIVTHAGGYRSVYGHLGQIFVAEGERVKAGASVGRVGESLEGYVLHFELWRERENLNPRAWLG